jgi:hypothetical protein
MKKVIMTLAIAVSSLLAFAGEENVSKNVLNAFNREFTGAREVKWTTGADYYRASFVYNEQYISAFYDRNGELMALTRNISSLNLPLKLQTRLRNDYSEYWISDLFEISNSEGTHYYITLEKADTKVVLKSDDNTQWTVFKKMSKV